MMKMQHATRMVPRRPRRSEYEARKAPQKHPAVNKATTVPDRESELDWRKVCLKESDATTSAITPLHDVSEHQPGEKAFILALTDHNQRGRIQWLQSSQSGIGRLLTSSLVLVV
jgi:hypothetical protein